MGLTIKTLAAGSISGTATVIYPPGAAAKGTIVKSMIFSNSSTQPATIEVKMRPASDPMKEFYIAPMGLLIQPGGTFVLDATLTLAIATPPDLILAWQSAGAGSVSYVMSGVERDQ